jgi:very long chain acyl-CoA dehydrogenase
LIFYRCLATQTQAKTQDVNKKAPNSKEQPKENQSFVHNLFRGEVQHNQVFPFPIALDSEQIEFIGAFVDPVTKFFTEVNDPVKNDDTASVDEKTADALWELGAFGLMVINFF